MNQPELSPVEQLMLVSIKKTLNSLVDELEKRDGLQNAIDGIRQLLATGQDLEVFRFYFDFVRHYFEPEPERGPQCKE